MLYMDALFNSLLVVSSGYAMYTLKPFETSYVYAVAAISLVHGLIGAVHATNNTSGNTDDDCTQLTQLTGSVVEILPLPLTNIELYLRSASPSLAMAHVCFVIPLIYDFIAKCRDNEDPSTEMLKELTLLGNMVSMLFLGVNENNNIYGILAGIGFAGRYGPVFLDYYFGRFGNDFRLLVNSIFILTLALTMSPSTSSSSSLPK